MAIVVNIHDAKTRFSKLLELVQLGDEIVIAKAGRPIARIVPFVAMPLRRKPGTANGLISMSPDFDAPLPDDLQKAFED
jgi:prevent-host-death family protein